MYFSRFPQILHLAKEPKYREKRAEYLLTDITANVRFRKDILDKITLFDYYIIKEGDTPEIVSEKLYDSPMYHWMIMLLNNVYDYRNDWPMTASALDKYIEKKYESLSAAKGKILFFVDEEGNFITPDPVVDGGITKYPMYVNDDRFNMSIIKFYDVNGVEVSQPHYNGLGTPIPVYAYNYEIEQNEKKRRIRVVSKQMASQIAANFRELV